jgi:hypothetical protein
LKLDYLKLTNADPASIAQATYHVINALQSLPAEDRALASAIHLKLTTEITGVDRHDLMTLADNLMSSPDGQGRSTEFRAAKDYMENEK